MDWKRYILIFFFIAKIQALQNMTWMDKAALWQGCDAGDLARVQLFIQKFGAEAVFNTKDTRYPEQFCLHKAAYSTNPSATEVIWLLLKEGANPDQFDFDEWTPLEIAAEYGSLSTMEILLAYGADASHDHSHSLRWAKDDRNRARLLLQHGADPDDRNHERSSFMDAVHAADLNKIQEIAKWKVEVEPVTKEDIYHGYRDSYDQVMEAIQRGREERKTVIDLDECLSNPCEHLGTCQDKFDGYECFHSGVKVMKVHLWVPMIRR